MGVVNITKPENNADVLVSLIGEEPVTVRTAMQIPMICRCVNMIAGAVAMLPIKLYRRTEAGVEEITEDRRLDILNRDTGDTMCADYMRYAWVRDLLRTGAGTGIPGRSLSSVSETVQRPRIMRQGWRRSEQG